MMKRQRATRGGLSRALACLGAAAMLVGFLPALPASAGAGTGLVRASKQLLLPPIENQDLQNGMHFLIDEHHRRGYAIVPTGEPARSVLVSYDLDALTLLKQAQLEHTVVPGMGAMDSVNRRLLIPYTEPNPAGRPVFAGVAVVNGENLQETDALATPSFQEGRNPSPGLAGLSLWQSPDGSTSKLYVLLQNVYYTDPPVLSYQQNIVQMAQWDVTTGQQDWIHRVAACQGRLPEIYPPGPVGQDFFRDSAESALYMGCVSSSRTGLAVRLTIGEGNVITEEVTSGPTRVDGKRRILADAGGRRLGFVATSPEGQESVFVYDGTQSAFVGAIAVGDQTVGESSYRVDGTTGRLVIFTPDRGYMLADMRRTPSQQALQYPEFLKDSKAGDIMLTIEPATPGHPRRFFARYNPQEPTIHIVEDHVDVSTDPLLSDVDRFTVQQKERAGITDSSFEARIHGFGLRALIVGGADGLVPAGTTTAGQQARAGGLRGQARGLGSACTLYQRELLAGTIPEIAISKGTAVAAAGAAGVDKGSTADVERPLTRCWAHDPNPGNPGLNSTWAPYFPEPEDLRVEGVAETDRVLDGTLGREWAFEMVECSGDGKETAAEVENLSGFKSNVVCDATNSTARGFSQARVQHEAIELSAGAGPLVKVGESSATGEVKALPGGGVYARSEAWARGIEIVGVGTIELVSTVATSTAKGLAGSAKGIFDRKICGITLLSGEEQSGCSDAQTWIARLNQALGARGWIRMREPDAELKAGSPGGYLASVQKDRFEALSDAALNNDATDHVIGLEILMVNDDPDLGRGRQLYQFAGVDAATTYGIFLLPQDVPPPVIPPIPPITTVIPGGFETGPGGGGGGGIGPAPTSESKTVTNTIVEKVRDGWRVAVRDADDAVLATLMWLAVGAPLYFVRRRRSLARSLLRREAA